MGMFTSSVIVLLQESDFFGYLKGWELTCLSLSTLLPLVVFRNCIQLALGIFQLGALESLQKRQHIIQFTQRGDHPMAIASNAWDFEGDRRALRRPHLSYATAVSLLEHDEVDTIIDVFNLPEEVDHTGDIGEVIHAATGQDVTMPPPNAEGEVILDQEGMRLMKVSQLRLLHQRTIGCRASTKKSKEKII